jgi:hypothetical protein
MAATASALDGHARPGRRITQAPSFGMRSSRWVIVLAVRVVASASSADGSLPPATRLVLVRG